MLPSALADRVTVVWVLSGAQSIFGYQLASPLDATVALCAAVGPDVPPEALRWLSERGALSIALQQVSHATPRAWQLFERDGRRTQVWRTLIDEAELRSHMLQPSAATLPAAVRAAPAFHIGIHPESFELDLIRALKRGGRPEAGRPVATGERAVWHPSRGAGPGCQPPRGSGPWLSAETFTAAARQLTSERLRALVTCCDVVSPNLLEAESMVGRGSPQAVRAPPGSRTTGFCSELIGSLFSHSHPDE
jgi:hypothetical protein